MRGSLVHRGPNRWAIIIDGDVVVDPVTGKKSRKQRWLSFTGSKAKAKEKRDAILHARRTGTYVEPTTTTVIEYLKTWLEKSVKPMRRPQTFRCYTSVLDNHIATSALADLPLQELRGSDLERYYADLKVAPATVKVHHALMHAALKRAIKDRLLTVNPATGAEFVRVKSTHADVREHCWSALEAQRFLTAAKDEGAQVAAYFALALDTGARKSELNGLTWANVDLDAGTMLIDRQLDSIGTSPDYTPRWGPTKTKQIRTVALSAETLTLLKAHRRQQRELKMRNRTVYCDYNLVFAREDADLQTPHAKLGHALNTLTEGPFKRIMKAACVKVIKPHGLRHTSITLMLAAGVAVHVVARRVGHTDASMTLNTYAHCLPDQNAAAAKTLASVLHSRG